MSRLSRMRTSPFSCLVLLLVAVACAVENAASLLSHRRMASATDVVDQGTTSAVLRFDKGQRLGRTLQGATQDLQLSGVSMVLDGVSVLQGGSGETWAGVTATHIVNEIFRILAGAATIMLQITLYPPSNPTPESLFLEFDVDASITSTVENHNLAEYVEEAFDSEDDKETYMEALRATGDPALVGVTWVFVIVPGVEPTTTTEPPTSTPTVTPTLATTVPPTATPTTATANPPTPATTILPPFFPQPAQATSVPPTVQPTDAPTISPTETPTVSPTEAPTSPPTPETADESPTTEAPSGDGAAGSPTTSEPTTESAPTQAPSEDGMSVAATGSATASPSSSPNYTGLIVGVALAGAVCIAMIAFLVGRSCKSNDNASTFATDERQDQPTKEYLSVIQVPSEGVREDEISTLGDPMMIAATNPTGGDSSTPSVSTLGYDFQKAYAGGVNKPRSPNHETAATDCASDTTSLQYPLNEVDKGAPSVMGDSLAYSQDNDGFISEPSNASAPYAVYAIPPAYRAPRQQEDVANERQRKVSWSSSTNTGSSGALYVSEESLDAVYDEEEEEI